MPEPESPREHAEACLARIDTGDAAVWVSRVAADEVLARAASATGVLAPATVGVKDNIDVAGSDTTAGCPSYGYRPDRTATAVRRLVDAGAVVVGKTNLDQFATGLVGTRSPYGAVANPLVPGLVSGGSSSGSAAAVALGQCDLGVGTDTAGSGRVPAAFCGVVGLKGTRGWLPTTGVVPACESFDCVTVFGRSVTEAAAAMSVMAGPDDGDPRSRSRPDAAAPVIRRIGVPSAEVLDVCDTVQRDGFAAARDRAVARGYVVVEVDLTAYLAAGRLLYADAFVAERYAAVGEHIAAGSPDLDPSVAAIVAGGAHHDAVSYVLAARRLARLAADAADVWDSVDAVLTPVATHHPTLDEVAADPIGVNGRLGHFVSGCNLVDWCAAVVPVAAAGAPPVGVQVLGPAWSDEAIWHVAADLRGEAWQPSPGSPRIVVAVAGAHLSGQPLNHQLTDRGAAFVAAARTAPCYRMVLLEGEVPKPGLLRSAEAGAAIDVELWELDVAGFGELVSLVPPPLAIGSVELDDAQVVKGFLCESVAADTAPDITGYASWRAWLERR